MKGVPVLTAVSDAVWEAALVSAFERGDLGVVVVRRCVDLAELLAVAGTRTARAVLLSADVRRLDREVVSRLAAAGLAVLGVAEPGDEAAQRLLYQCGVPVVLEADAAPADVAEAIARAVGLRADSPSTGLGSLAYGDPLRAMPDLVPVDLLGEQDAAPDHGSTGDQPVAGLGRVVAVWGPTGAPGRTSVAMGVADELSAAGVATMLIDADTYGGAVAQLLGLLEEAPGLVAAVRAAMRGSLDVGGLALLARDVGGGLRVLTGLLRTDRWPELPVDAFVRVLDLGRALVDVVVVDCGFCLEQDEELA